jgi:putative endonuclease
MDKEYNIGKIGENIACEYLSKNRYKIIERNFLKPWGEIDIIAKRNDGLLIFFEVKTMVKSGNLKPEDNLTRAKLKKLQKTAAGYASSHYELIDKNIGWRIDLLAIDIDPEYEAGSKMFEIRHFENFN